MNKVKVKDILKMVESRRQAVEDMMDDFGTADFDVEAGVTVWMNYCNYLNKEFQEV